MLGVQSLVLGVQSLVLGVQSLVLGVQSLVLGVQSLVLGVQSLVLGVQRIMCIYIYVDNPPSQRFCRPWKGGDGWIWHGGGLWHLEEWEP